MLVIPVLLLVYPSSACVSVILAYTPDLYHLQLVPLSFFCFVLASVESSIINKVVFVSIIQSLQLLPTHS